MNDTDIDISIASVSTNMLHIYMDIWMNKDSEWLLLLKLPNYCVVSRQSA